MSTKFTVVKTCRATVALVAAVTVLTVVPARVAGQVEELGQETDLYVQITSPATVPVGDEVTYRITVGNKGPGDAPGAVGGRVGSAVVLSDLLPAGMTYVGSSAPGWDCRRLPEGGRVAVMSCTLESSLPSGGSTLVTVTVKADVPGRLVNTAAVSTGGGAFNVPFVPNDPDRSNNQQVVTTTVNGGVAPPGTLPDADLSLTMTANRDAAPVGAAITYRLAVRNNSPAHEAPAVRLTDLLPPGVARRSANSSVGSCEEQVPHLLACELGNLAPNAMAEVTIVVVAEKPGPAVNTAAVVSRSVLLDPPGNNTASVVTTVSGDALANGLGDLEVTMTDAPDPVPVGADLTYSITVRNVTDVWSPEQTLFDLLPPGIDLKSASASNDEPGAAPHCLAHGNLDVYQVCIVDPLAPGSSVTFRLVVVAPAPGQLVNTVVVIDRAGQDTAPNHAIETTTVAAGQGAPGEASLALGMEDRPDPVRSGARLTYTLSVTNAGPDVADNVAVTDLLPPGVSFRSAPEGCAYDDAPRTVVCRRTRLAAGASASWDVIVVPDGAGTITNSARVDSTTRDPDVADNQRSEATTVQPAADLSVSARSSASSPTVGDEVTYSFAVANQGPDRAVDTMLVAALPTSLAFRSSSSGCSFDTASSTLTCSLGTRAGGESAQVDLKAVPLNRGRLTTSARVESQTFDPETSDNEATVDIDAGCVALGLPRGDQVPYPAGWSLIGLPDGTRVNAQSKLYGWFDRNDDGDYSMKEPNEAVVAGHGYWAYFGCPRLIDVTAGATTVTFSLGAFRASMVGNPSGVGPVTVSGHDFAARWDPSLNSGSGGYHYSGYREPIALAPGEGAWVFSYVNTEIVIGR